MIRKDAGGIVVVDGKCQSSLGRRNVNSLPKDCHSSKISVTVHGGTGQGLEASVWFTDKEGRTFGAKFEQEFLLELSEAVKIGYETINKGDIYA